MSSAIGMYMIHELCTDYSSSLTSKCLEELNSNSLTQNTNGITFYVQISLFYVKNCSCRTHTSCNTTCYILFVSHQTREFKY